MGYEIPAMYILRIGWILSLCMFFPPCYEVVSADLLQSPRLKQKMNLPLALAEKTGGWWAVALAIREEEICDSDLAEEPGHVD